MLAFRRGSVRGMGGHEHLHMRHMVLHAQAPTRTEQPGSGVHPDDRSNTSPCLGTQFSALPQDPPSAKTRPSARVTVACTAKHRVGNWKHTQGARTQRTEAIPPRDPVSEARRGGSCACGAGDTILRIKVHALRATPRHPSARGG